MAASGINKKRATKNDGIDDIIFALWWEASEYSRARERASERKTPVRPYKTAKAPSAQLLEGAWHK